MINSNLSYDNAVALFKEHGQLAICEYDVQNDFLYISEAAGRLIDCQEGIYENGRTVREGFLKGASIGGDLFDVIISGKRRQFTTVEKVLLPSGEQKFLKVHAVIRECDESGAPSVISILVFDITSEKLHQDSLLAEKKHLEFLFHISGIGSWDYDVKADIMRFDDDYRNMLGLTVNDQNENLQNMCDKLVHPDDQEGIMSHMREYLQNPEGVFYHEMRFRHQNGRYIWLQDTGVISERDSKGNPLRMVGSVVNIDAQKESKLRELKEAKDEAEHRSKLLSAINLVASSLLAAQPEQFDQILKNCMQMVGKEIGVDRIRIVKNFMEDGTLFCERLHFWADRDEFDIPESTRTLTRYKDMPFIYEKLANREIVDLLCENLPEPDRAATAHVVAKSFLLTPIFLHEKFWGFVAFDNCTEEKSYRPAEIEMLRSVAVLYISGIVRNQSMQQLIIAKEEALASASSKAEFLSRMSHEIRTPMNAIIGMTAIATRATDWKKLQDCLNRIDSSSRQLLGIINDVLDMSKIDADKFELTNSEFDLEKMISNTQSIIQVRVEEKRQNFIYDFERVFDRKLFGDELRLSQVLINLLSNAVKFTPECGDITLKVRERKESEDSSVLRFEVIDNGIGVPDKHKPVLFNSFEQGNGSIGRQFGGTGLGLAISKRIVELMGGRIWVESIEGEGADFVFEIPVTWGSVCDYKQTKVDLKKEQRILVIDDADETLSYFENILIGFSMIVDCATDADEALKLVQESVDENNPYDVVFVDWHMPEAEGGELAKKVRGILGDDVLIILISASDQSEMEEYAAQHEIRHCLQKPVLPSTMYDALLKFSAQAIHESTEKLFSLDYDWSRFQILLVEDVEINRLIVTSLFEETEIKIDCAEDGLQAINMFSKHPSEYDLILMDVQMPVLDGLTATRKIRELPFPEAATVPIVAMTANAFREDVQDCLEAGMTDHLAKPIDWAECIRVMNKYLK